MSLSCLRYVFGGLFAVLTILELCWFGSVRASWQTFGRPKFKRCLGCSRRQNTLHFENACNSLTNFLQPHTTSCALPPKSSFIFIITADNSVNCWRRVVSHKGRYDTSIHCAQTLFLSAVSRKLRGLSGPAHQSAGLLSPLSPRCSTCV